MTRAARRPRFALLPALALLLTVAPACSATAGSRWGERLGFLNATDRPSDRVAYRPSYRSPRVRTKPLYLSGYAGAAYGPNGPGGPVNPTSYQAPACASCPPPRLGR